MSYYVISKYGMVTRIDCGGHQVSGPAVPAIEFKTDAEAHYHACRVAAAIRRDCDSDRRPA